MKYNNSYVLKSLAGETILVFQSEEQVNFSKIITLNEIGKLIVEGLQNSLSKEEIVNKLLEEYEIDRATVEADVEEFVNKLLELGVVSND